MEYIMELKEIVNASPTNLTSGFDTGYNIFIPVILLAIGIGVMAILLTVSANITKYRRFKRILKSLSKTFSYCAFGMLTVAIVGFPVYFGYLGINTAVENPKTSLEVGKWIGIIIGCFVGFTVVGYATKNRIWKRLWKFHKIETEYKKNIDELPGLIT